MPGPSKMHILIPICKTIKLPNDHVGSFKDKIAAGSKKFLTKKSYSRAS